MEKNVPIIPEAPRDEAPSYSSNPGPSDLPAYAQAASEMPSLPTYSFIRPSVFSSKLLVRCNGIDRYCFATDSGKDPKVWMYAGASKTNEPLGCLTFPEAHNNFHVHCAAADEYGKKGETLTDKNYLSAPLIDVAAGIGYPHPKTFSLGYPKGLATSVKDLVWVHKSGNIDDKTPARYDLHTHNSEGTRLASLTTSTKAGMKGTTVQWVVTPGTELEQAALIMSAIGLVTRLSRKGKYYKDKGMYSRWRYLWWMSTLAAVPVG